MLKTSVTEVTPMISTVHHVVVRSFEEMFRDGESSLCVLAFSYTATFDWSSTVQFDMVRYVNACHAIPNVPARFFHTVRCGTTQLIWTTSKPLYWWSHGSHTSIAIIYLEWSVVGWDRSEACSLELDHVKIVSWAMWIKEEILKLLECGETAHSITTSRLYSKLENI